MTVLAMMAAHVDDGDVKMSSVQLPRCRVLPSFNFIDVRHQTVRQQTVIFHQ